MPEEGVVSFLVPILVVVLAIGVIKSGVRMGGCGTHGMEETFKRHALLFDAQHRYNRPSSKLCAEGRRASRRHRKQPLPSDGGGRKKVPPGVGDDQFSVDVVVSEDDGTMSLAIFGEEEVFSPENGSEVSREAFLGEIREDIVRIYSDHAPEKVQEVDSLLTKYAGREPLLLSAIEAKYLGASGGPLRTTDDEARKRAEKALRLNEEARRAAVDKRKQEIQEAAAGLEEANLDQIEDRATTLLSLETSLDTVRCSAALGTAVRRLAQANELSRAIRLAEKSPPDWRWRRANKKESIFCGRSGVLADLATSLLPVKADTDLLDRITEAASGTSLACFAILLCAREAEPTALIAAIDNLPKLDELDDESTLLAFAEAVRTGAKGRPGLALDLADAAERLFGDSAELCPELSEFSARAIAQNAKRLTDADTMGRMPQPLSPEVVLLGRSNVGKSSLVNGLLGRKALAPTSPQPGRTRRFVFYDIVLTDGRGIIFVDIPGAGFARLPSEDESSSQHVVSSTSARVKKRKDSAEKATLSPKIESWRALTYRYLRVREPLAVVLQLLDARRWSDDGKVPSVDLDTVRLAAEANVERAANPNTRPFSIVLVLTKIDKLGSKRLAKARNRVAEEVRSLGLFVDQRDLRPGQNVHLVATSATARPPRGRRALWRRILAGLGDSVTSPPLLDENQEGESSEDEDDAVISF